LNPFELIKSCELELADEFAQIDSTCDLNLQRVLNAFSVVTLSESDLVGSTGYGLGDTSRDKLERVYSLVFGGEASLVRPQIASGTHAIACVLFGLLRPGDVMVSITGTPYDTLQEVIGIRQSAGSLAEFGIGYKETDWRCDNPDGSMLDENTKIVYIQRSSGYRRGHSVTINQLSGWIDRINVKAPNAVVVVDNCYCEFIGDKTPCDLGADVTVGSLIKNPGGGLAKTGGYIVGKKDLVEKIATRVTAPGIGSEVGATFGFIRDAFHGLYLAPSISASALKGALLWSRCFEKLGHKVFPLSSDSRADIVTSIELGSRDKFIKFGKAIQSVSPIDSTSTPEPFAQGGYDADVLLSGGGFITGSTSELSADGLDKSPYVVYVQGGVNMSHIRLGIARVIEALSS